jgi:sugar/nucleoside kinase (ribokinase family)
MDIGKTIPCIGAALWDIIGRTPAPMTAGADVAGRIVRVPGGVALNIAMALVRAGAKPAVLAAIGQDPEGDALVQAISEYGIETDYIYRAPDLPTDTYMAIEGAGGLVAAIADVHSLEIAGARVLAPLRDGRLASEAAPWRGMIALDGNLTVALLAEIASAPVFAQADLRVAPASPGKGERVLPLLARSGTTFYVNLAEAGLICGTTFARSAQAAEALVQRGARRVLVTDGAHDTTDASAEQMITRAPPKVDAQRITGAGDTFMAAHMAAEAQGADRTDALDHALSTAARYVAGHH